MSTLLCAGVMSPGNAPVHVHAFGQPLDAELGDPATSSHSFLPVLHCALDAVEARLRVISIAHAAGGNAVGAVAGAGKGPRDAFLGMVYPTEDHRVYAYVTNTRAKLLLLYDDRAIVFVDALSSDAMRGDPDAKEPDEAVVREAFSRLHAAYADAMSSPFAKPGRRIESPRFDAAVRALGASA